MLFSAEFGQHADQPNVFKQALQPHLDYLELHKDKVLLSATKYDHDGKKALGFLWLIEARDFAEAESICQQDPFWIAGLRTSFELTQLIKALPHHKSMI